MANTVNSPNMLLPVPVVGQDPGPQWASDVNSCLSLIDSHDHTPGKGIQLTPSSLNINADLPLNNNNLTLTRTVRFTSQSTVLTAPADLPAAYVVSGDLYFNDGVGNQVRITQAGAVAGTPGSIANLTPPASASYVSANDTFVFQSGANTAANIDGGSIVLRDVVANSHGVTLAPPSSIAADYTINLPNLPSTQNIMTLDASGNIGAALNVDNVTIVIASNNIQIPSNVALPGNQVKVDGKNVTTSNTNTTNGLAIIRGSVRDDGVKTGGEGFTSSYLGGGIYHISYSTAFADTPSATFAANSSNTSIPNVNPSGGGISSTDCFVTWYDAPSNSPIGTGFTFIIIGQRA